MQARTSLLLLAVLGAGACGKTRQSRDERVERPAEAPARPTPNFEPYGPSDAPEGWKKVEARTSFVMMMPPDMHAVPVRGNDSFVGQYVSDTIRLSFDYGEYSNPLLELDHPEFEGRTVTIGGKTGWMVKFRATATTSSLTYRIGVHFPDGGDGKRKLTVEAGCADPEARASAEQILRSIRFPK